MTLFFREKKNKNKNTDLRREPYLGEERGGREGGREERERERERDIV